MTAARVFLKEARFAFHESLLSAVLRIDSKGVPSNADKDSKLSVSIAKGIVNKIGLESHGSRLSGQMAGANFENICSDYLSSTFAKLIHLRPGKWEIGKGRGGRLAIAQYDQYEHLASLAELAKETPSLSAAIGSDYLIKPDVVVIRFPEDDSEINTPKSIVDDSVAKLTSLRAANNPKPILHASISCKWTLRSDRAQNARSEALNLIRNRKGRLPHIVVVTGEPTPNRIASIALGTGDIDCVYHFALKELIETVEELNYMDAKELLQTMIEGKRLRDISDLPLDLVI